MEPVVERKYNTAGAYADAVVERTIYKRDAAAFHKELARTDRRIRTASQSSPRPGAWPS